MMHPRLLNSVWLGASLGGARAPLWLRCMSQKRDPVSLPRAASAAVLHRRVRKSAVRDPDRSLCSHNEPRPNPNLNRNPPPKKKKKVSLEPEPEPEPEPPPTKKNEP